MDSTSGSKENLHWKKHPWGGVIPATLCAFRKDETVDGEAVDRYITELAKVPGITGLTCNGHTGEIMSLRPPERAAVTRVVAGAVRKTGRNVKVIFGVMCEGSLDAIDHGRAAKEAGADAILLMPPHRRARIFRS